SAFARDDHRAGVGKRVRLDLRLRLVLLLVLGVLLRLHRRLLVSRGARLTIGIGLRNHNAAAGLLRCVAGGRLRALVAGRDNTALTAGPRSLVVWRRCDL